jgi:phosphoribosylaminoimidazole-succinocarboxamide synthase
MSLLHSDFQFPYDTRRTSGKVRDLYDIEGQLLVLVATDRVSAFDVILPATIPAKGQLLNSLSAFLMRQQTAGIPHHLLAVPHPRVSIVRRCDPYPVEVVVRGHLCGHAWRLYRSGQRAICGVELPEGLRENDALPQPIVTPTTKSRIGHDTDLTESEITRSGLIPADEWMQIRSMALELFSRGQEWAAERGLILADAKYEFGYADFQIWLIDELHTPDAARYFLAEGFDERQNQGAAQPQYSKEYLRQQLLASGYSGQEDVPPPPLAESLIDELGQRYRQVFEQLTGQAFAEADDTPAQIQSLIEAELARFLQLPS